MGYLNASSLLSNVSTLADTTFTKQAVNTTLVALNDSTITYTPSAGAKKVVFECDGAIAWSPDATGSYMCVRLQYSADGGSTWTTITGTELFAGNDSSSNDYNWHAYSWSCQVDAWTGSRQLRLYARSHTSSTEFTWGLQYLSPGSYGIGAAPVITVTSVMV